MQDSDAYEKETGKFEVTMNDPDARVQWYREGVVSGKIQTTPLNSDKVQTIRIPAPSLTLRALRYSIKFNF